ncbi:hypothetical protein UA08_05055 [Talaromyces atroroseus]|uniref:FAD-binding domain-containing protein n=1 Tax=Talaromyces atroroseus TaxID=1441469 RepID=A0A225AEA2_TALAT|nr:hypothetical protein UA08_05055 [Talaromyces atroroseus]OKL59582.1 hypothetical protein UA08_05055 [Talaromyces atroroseus]
MTSLKVLICGGGCAGPALAYWLSLSGHQVVVVERFPAIRATGAQIDIRAQGIEVIKQMGLLDTIRTKLVHEPSVSLVDSAGKANATIMANTSGKGAQSLTSEYEIMRGDLVRILYDATKGKVNYIFGRTVDCFEQDEQQVVAYFSDGSSNSFDLLLAYSFIQRTEDDSNFHEMFLSPGGRLVARRSHSPSDTQVYFILKDNSENFMSLSKVTIEQQREFWASRFADAGWQTPRFLQGIEATNNFYCQEAVQVCIDSWHKGRVVLLSDAAYCSSPFSAMGTTGSFVGAYVLAGEINRHRGDLAQALINYEQRLRPFVNEMQKIHPSFIRLMLPDTQLGISVIHFVLGLICFLRIPGFLSRFTTEDQGGWKLPDYPKIYQTIQ